MLLLAGMVAAQEPGDERPGPGEDVAVAGQVGIRFTPEMARAMGRLYVDKVAVERYGLDTSKAEQVEESVARRLMAMAHTLDGQGYNAVLEGVVATMVEAEQEDRASGGSQGMPPRAGQAFSKAAKPLLPLIRELGNGVSKDLRPLLAPSQQLKLAGDVLAFNTGLDAFSKTMNRWAEGEVRPFEDPFGDETNMKRDAEGRTQAYKNAIQAAERDLDKQDWSSWKRYVEDAKKFYEFDDSQAATADSVLRECLDQAEALVQAGDYRERALRNRVWFHMLWQLRIGTNHPLREYVEKQMKRMSDPIEDIQLDLRRRIDRIPTYAQRQASDQRMMGLLAEQGYDASFVAGTPVGGESPAGESQEAEESQRPPSAQAPTTDRGGVR